MNNMEKYVLRPAEPKKHGYTEKLLKTNNIKIINNISKTDEAYIIEVEMDGMHKLRAKGYYLSRIFESKK